MRSSFLPFDLICTFIESLNCCLLAASYDCRSIVLRHFKLLFLQLYYMGDTIFNSVECVCVCVKRHICTSVIQIFSLGNNKVDILSIATCAMHVASTILFSFHTSFPKWIPSLHLKPAAIRGNSSGLLIQYNMSIPNEQSEHLNTKCFFCFSQKKKYFEYFISSMDATYSTN